MQMNIENISEYLKSHNIKPSYQRMKIFEFLLDNRTHPTVDEIYQTLVKEIPTLSKTTVYNTLNLFVKEKITLLITIEENETRYDADTDIHGHFKCEKCGIVYDFSTDISELTIKELDNFQINQQDIYFKGLCVNCIN
jgi:Fe2+ or Zn2+ uptake regulation protein